MVAAVAAVTGLDQAALVVEHQAAVEMAVEMAVMLHLVQMDLVEEAAAEVV